MSWLRDLGRRRTLVRWLEDLGQDLTYALRTLRRRPLFTAGVLATLALGIGVSVAVFSIVYPIVLRPLPFHEPDRLVRVWTEYPDSMRKREWVTMRDQATAFEDMAFNSGWGFTLTGEEESVLLSGLYHSANLLPMLGIRPLLGRLSAPADMEPGAPAVTLISERLWRTRYGSDPGILGPTLRLNNIPFTEIGVLGGGLGLLAGSAAAGVLRGMLPDWLPRLEAVGVSFPVVLLAAVLAVGAGLIVRSYSNMVYEDIGFRPDHAVSAVVAINTGNSEENDRQEMRLFNARDTEDSEPVGLVNQTFADAFWPWDEAVGKEVRMYSAAGPRFTVVGVVGDVHQQKVAEPPRPEFYRPDRQWALGWSSGPAGRTWCGR